MGESIPYEIPETDVASELFGSHFMLESAILAIEQGTPPENVLDQLRGISASLGLVAVETSKLQRQNRYDSLTGLLSGEAGLASTILPVLERYYYADTETQSAYEMHDKHPWVVMAIDMDNLKPVNDKHGHDVGDQVIEITAQAVEHAIRPDDFALRLHGDEFEVYLRPDTTKPKPKQEDLPGEIVEKRINAFLQAAEYTGKNNRVYQGLSVTAGFAPIHSLEELQAAREQADLMLIEQKRLKKKGNVGKFIDLVRGAREKT